MMRCLSCNYDLRNLPEHRCPECGREFDPNDASTFLSEPVRSERARWESLDSMYILAAIVLLVLFFTVCILMTGW